MECKVSSIDFPPIPSFRINRNIVECKAIQFQIPLNGESCINRNIVECKEKHITLILPCKCVLIETLWNVKFQWGVWVTAWARRINRNIVECKVHEERYNAGFRSVLIETLWNVKSIVAFPPTLKPLY